MTAEELRALAEKARDHNREGMSLTEALYACASLGSQHNRILALLDANVAMVAALRQAAWHMGTDPDRNALVQAGHGWKTTSVEAADMIRAALALAEKQP